MPELRLQYKDYAVWQNKLLRDGAFQAQGDYWRDVLGEALPVLNMPLDYRRTPNRTFAGAKLTFNLSKVQRERMEKLARIRQTTLNTLAFSIYALLINQFSAQDDLIVGLTVSGRQHPDLDNLIGVFINFLPIRIAFNHQDTFLAYLDLVKEIIYRAYQHQDFPFEMMVASLNAKQDPARNPIFDTMLLFHNENEFMALDNLVINSLKFSNYEFERHSAALDFKIDIYPSNQGELWCVLEYNTTLFKSETIKQIVQHFEKLVEWVLSHPDQELAGFEIFTGAEKVELEQKRRFNFAEAPKAPALLPLVISASFTADPVSDYIKWWCRQFDIEIDVQFAPYNQVFQELLDAGANIPK